ncbi:MAG: hypothetical protein EA360_05160 [Balneolaceae bacterium]|nr:MAG: hypothetical protein EA360_05160 [Balneolaceae bacterium]
MKILYGIQGTGHGHISRAREIVPVLSEKSDVTLLISGYNCHLELEGYEVIKKRGISLAYDDSGGVSYLNTVAQIQPLRFFKDLESIDMDSFDLIISDYEPLSAWAARFKRKPSVALSHQAAFLSAASPRPEKKSRFAEQILRNFAPCNHSVGFHFRRYDSFIQPPVVRREVLGLTLADHGHVTVYLPAFDPSYLSQLFKQFPDRNWHIFSPLCTTPFTEDNVEVWPVGNRAFLKSMSESNGIITGAGFETCAEAMFLGKKLLVMPIRNQYEQYCNAAALSKIGIDVIWNPPDRLTEQIRFWIDHSEPVSLPEIADIDQITNELLLEVKESKSFYMTNLYPSKAS